jgi:hypothetical protein
MIFGKFLELCIVIVAAIEEIASFLLRGEEFFQLLLLLSLCDWL